LCVPSCVFVCVCVVCVCVVPLFSPQLQTGACILVSFVL
jgi:hypothetical protein